LIAPVKDVVVSPRSLALPGQDKLAGGLVQGNHRIALRPGGSRVGPRFRRLGNSGGVEAPPVNALGIAVLIHAGPRDDELAVGFGGDARAVLIVGRGRVDLDFARQRDARAVETARIDPVAVAILVDTGPHHDEIAGGVIGHGLLAAAIQGRGGLVVIGRRVDLELIAQHTLPCHQARVVRRPGTVDDAGLVFKSPVAAECAVTRQVIAGGDVGTGQGRQSLDEGSPRLAGADIATVDQDVRVATQRIAPGGDLASARRQGLIVEPGGA
jgi:hypothetical protein